VKELHAVTLLPLRRGGSPKGFFVGAFQVEVNGLFAVT